MISQLLLKQSGRLFGVFGQCGFHQTLMGVDIESGSEMTLMHGVRLIAFNLIKRLIEKLTQPLRARTIQQRVVKYLAAVFKGMPVLIAVVFAGRRLGLDGPGVIG